MEGGGGKGGGWLKLLLSLQVVCCCCQKSIHVFISRPDTWAISSSSSSSSVLLLNAGRSRRSTAAALLLPPRLLLRLLLRLLFRLPSLLLLWLGIWLPLLLLLLWLSIIPSSAAFVSSSDAAVAVSFCNLGSMMSESSDCREDEMILDSEMEQQTEDDDDVSAAAGAAAPRSPLDDPSTPSLSSETPLVFSLSSLLPSSFGRILRGWKFLRLLRRVAAAMAADIIDMDMGSCSCTGVICSCLSSSVARFSLLLLFSSSPLRKSASSVCIWRDGHQLFFAS